MAYEEIVEAANRLRPLLPGLSVIGLAVPPGVEVETLGLTRSAGLRPFTAAGTTGTRTVVLLPDARQPIDPARVLAIRVLRALGGTVFVTVGLCAALRSRFPVGSLVAVVDHLNLTGTSPLVGPNDERIGPRFPGMAEPYATRLLDQAEQIAASERVTVQRVVYAGVAGPDLPTPAEDRFLASVGADVYGVGLIPDTLTAVHAGVQVLALAVVTACRSPDGVESGDPPAVMVPAGAVPGLTRVLARVIAEVSIA